MLSTIRLVLLVVVGGYGLVATARPRVVATMTEVIDARGSRAHSSEIEPTDTNVLLTRAGGVLALSVAVVLVAKWV